MSTFYNLPRPGREASRCSRTSSCARTRSCCSASARDGERDAFRQLIKITGVGARTALSVLSGMSVGDLAQAVTLQDAGRLTKVPGIGKKTAERLLLELKGKLGADLGAARSASTGAAARRRHPATRCSRSATATRKRPRRVKQLPDGRRAWPTASAGAEGAGARHDRRPMAIETDRRSQARGRRAAPASPQEEAIERALRPKRARRIRRPGEDPRAARDLHRARRASAARRSTTCCCSARRASARPRCRTSSRTSWASTCARPPGRCWSAPATWRRC